MGGQSSNIGSSFRPSDWQLINVNTQCKVWQNRSDRHRRIQQYQIWIPNDSQMQTQKKMYYMRNNHPLLVSTLYMHQEIRNSLCSTQMQYSVFIEKIPIRLSDIQHIPFPDYIHLYHQCLNGFQELIALVGCFSIEQQLICINEQSKVKVWLNQDVSKTYPSGGKLSQDAMVCSLIDCIQQNIDYATAGNLPNIKNYLYRNVQCLTFQQANRQFKQYVANYCGNTVPHRMQCVDSAGGSYLIANRQKSYEHKSRMSTQRPQREQDFSYYNHKDDYGYNNNRSRNRMASSQIFVNNSIQKQQIFQQRFSPQVSQAEYYGSRISYQPQNNLNHSIENTRNMVKNDNGNSVHQNNAQQMLSRHLSSSYLDRSLRNSSHRVKDVSRQVQPQIFTSHVQSEFVNVQPQNNHQQPRQFVFNKPKIAQALTPQMNRSLQISRTVYQANPSKSTLIVPLAHSHVNPINSSINQQNTSKNGLNRSATQLPSNTPIRFIQNTIPVEANSKNTTQRVHVEAKQSQLKIDPSRSSDRMNSSLSLVNLSQHSSQFTSRTAQQQNYNKNITEQYSNRSYGQNQGSFSIDMIQGKYTAEQLRQSRKKSYIQQLQQISQSQQPVQIDPYMLISFNPNAQLFTKKQNASPLINAVSPTTASTSTNSYHNDFKKHTNDLNEGKSSAQFLRQLQEMNLSSSQYLKMLSSSNNLSSQFLSNLSSNKTGTFNPSYGQNASSRRQVRPDSISQIQSQEISDYDDNFGGRDVSSKIISVGQSVMRAGSSQSINNAPLRFQKKNLDLKYSVMKSEIDSPKASYQKNIQTPVFQALPNSFSQSRNQ